MAYDYNSNWNDKFELECFLIFKTCQQKGFPRGLASELCEDLEHRSKNSPSAGSLKAKVGNFKSLAGVTNPSNHSQNSKRIFDRYKNHSIEQIKNILKNS